MVISWCDLPNHYLWSTFPEAHADTCRWRAPLLCTNWHKIKSRMRDCKYIRRPPSRGPRINSRSRKDPNDRLRGKPPSSSRASVSRNRDTVRSMLAPCASKSLVHVCLAARRGSNQGPTLWATYCLEPQSGRLHTKKDATSRNWSRGIEGLIKAELPNTDGFGLRQVQCPAAILVGPQTSSPRELLLPSLPRPLSFPWP
jgi:hypothetical protein